MTSEKKIAFLGLGAMGFGMATNLVKEGFEVVGYDVYGPTLERFVEAGGKRAETPKEVVKDATYVVFMVATAAQIVEALFGEEHGAIHSLAPKAIIILSSTGPPEHTINVRKLLDTKYSRSDIHLVDAPVSGGTIRAANGTLTILASGPDESLIAAKPVLDAMAGKNLYVIPGGLGAGTNVKMVHQVLAGIHITMASEAMGFAARLGLNTKEAFEELKSGEGSSWMFENRGPHMLVEDPKIYSALNIIVKDVGIVTAGGRAASFPLFLSSATEQVLATGVSSGYGLIDDSQLTRVYLPSDPTLVLKQASIQPSISREEQKNKLRLVKQVMAAVHLAAAVEAMSLGKRVGPDSDKLFEIISTAAGSSWMFIDRMPRLLGGKWDSTKTIDDTISELSEAVQEANLLKYPLHLGGTVLQLFQLARLKAHGKEPDVAVSKLWDGVDEPIFPRS